MAQQTTRGPALSDWLLLALLVTAWGSSFALVNLSVRELAPDWVVAARLVLAALMLLPLALATDRDALLRRDLWPWFFLLGFVGNIAPYYLIAWGQQFIPSGTAGILIAINPLATLVAASLVFSDEHLSKAKVGGFLLGFAGIVVLMGTEALAGLDVSGVALLGELAVLGGALFYAANTILSRLVPKSPFIARSAGTMLAASLMSVSAASALAPLETAALSVPTALAVLGLGFLSTAVATVVFFVLIDRRGASFVATSNYLVPVYAVFVGALFLGEPLEMRVLAALALVLVGIAISETGKQADK